MTSAPTTAARGRKTLYFDQEHAGWLAERARELEYETRGAITMADIVDALFAAGRAQWTEIERAIREAKGVPSGQ